MSIGQGVRQGVIDFAHDFLREAVNPGDVVVDATMGNGHDTAFLASLGARVFSFDVQSAAIENTRKLLNERGLGANLVHDGHENACKYIKVLKAAVFNLGYLPGSDKSVITKPVTTIRAMEKLCGMLQTGGRIAVVVYPGHDGGAQEADAVGFG